MKTNRLIIAIVLALFFNGYSQNLNTPDKLLGVITKNDLTSGAYGEWFNPQFASYTPNIEALSEIKKNINTYEIVVFMGTWCGDSRLEVPRFYKVLESVGYPLQKLKVIAVDNAKENYKKSPTGEEKGLNIHRVPTFIFYKNGKEINRIIEHPIVSIEADIQKIISSNLYEPNYKSIEVLENLLKEKSIEDILNSDEIMGQLRSTVKSENDFNSFGYMYLNSKKYDNAIAIFTLNNKLFPNSHNTFDSLAEAYQLSGDLELALKNYKLAYGLIMKNPVIVNLQEKIKVLQKDKL